jgi:hypothetical protein
MFVELLDRLRCPHAHEDNPLVATTAATFERYIVEGTLGCSVCLAEYRVHKGLMDMEGDFPVPALTPEMLSEEEATRRAALLGLDERGGLYLVDLIGRYCIPSHVGLSPDSKFVALSVLSRQEHAVMSICGRPEALPFAVGSMRGIAFDLDVGPSLLISAVKTLAPGGRLVAPSTTGVPPGVELLARDERAWVAERAASPVLNLIKRARH